MFRATKRSARALSRQECIEILVNKPRGAPSVHGAGGYPYAFSINPLHPGGKLYFHCAKAGHKPDAIAADAKVSLCIIGRGSHRAGESPLNIQSIIGFGRIRKIESERACLSSAHSTSGTIPRPNVWQRKSTPPFPMRRSSRFPSFP